MLYHFLVAILVEVCQFNLHRPIMQSFAPINFAKPFVFEQKFQQHTRSSIISPQNTYLTSNHNCCTIENISIPMQVDRN
jgi:hypothetical protein